MKLFINQICPSLKPSFSFFCRANINYSTYYFPFLSNDIMNIKNYLKLLKYSKTFI